MRFSIPPVGVALLIASAANAQLPDRPIITVGSAHAARGTTVTGALQVPAGVDSGLTIPVAVIHGARPGPIVALIAGTHATEYSTEIAMQRLIPLIDPAKLAGTVIIVPIVNVPSFTSMTPVINPVDRKTMVGGYPGDTAGSQSQRAMAMLTSEVVAQANVLVDFHGGDLDEDVGAPFVDAVRTGHPATDSLALRLARAFGVNHVLVTDRDPASPRAGGTLAGQGVIRGETVLLVGTGRSGVVAPADLVADDNGSLNMLTALGMLNRPTTRAKGAVIYLDGTGPRIAAQGAGVWFAVARPNTIIKKGAVLGYTTDLLGRKTGDVLSPVDGLVVYVHGVPSMQRGTVLAEVLPVIAHLEGWKTPARRRP
ncbi:MAG TPA: succinylglutamate desuccinylase/aspartoacylase family protein [Gemmatimonadales bacterium]|jgi:hypothetical protein